METTRPIPAWRLHPVTGEELPGRMDARDVESYTKSWNEGKVVFRGDVCGWEISEDDYRPLFEDGLEVLLMEGFITEANVEATNEARAIFTTETIAAYAQAQANRTPEQIAEQQFEARAAFGSGEKVVNILTGETYTT